jgi:hypothetical protein
MGVIVRRPGALRRAGVHRLATLVLALSLAALPVVPASAEPEWNGGYREKVDLAGGTWITETDNTFTDVTVRVFDITEQVLPDRPWSPDGPGFVLFYWHLEYDPATGLITETNYEGFRGLPGSTFQFDQSLRSGASASRTAAWSRWRCTYTDDGEGSANGFEPPDAPTPMAAEDADCAELGYTTVDVDLEWVGQGPIYRGVSPVLDGDPSEFRFHAQTVEAVRDAALTGRIGGEDVHLADGPATFGILLSGAHLEHVVING